MTGQGPMVGWRGRLLVVLFVLALAGHWAYWYRPREHTAAPDGETAAGALFLSGEQPYRFWLPYPHQNLARMERAVGNIERFTAAVARLTGRTPPRLPSFGSAVVPPARALALSVDESGEEFAAVASVYPIAGRLARLAGWLAGNPLLAGGSAQVDGREVEVRWEAGAWIVSTPGVVVPQSQSAFDAEPALAWVRLEKDRGHLPAGEYRLERSGPGLELLGGEDEVLAAFRSFDASPPPVPLLLTELSGTEGKVSGRSLALLPDVESLAGLPGAVTVHKGSRRWRLPGEKLLRLVGDGPPEARTRGWRIVAQESESLQQGEPLAAYLDSLDGLPPSVGVWIDVRQARRLVEQTVEALEAVPVIGKREAKRWRDLSVVLEALGASGALTAKISRQPVAVRVRLDPRPLIEAAGAAD